MADGPTNPGSIPVGGIYATVQIDASTTASDLESIRAILAMTDKEFGKLVASARSSGVSIIEFADNYEVGATRAASAARMFAVSVGLCDEAIRQQVADTRGAAAAGQMYADTFEGMAKKTTSAGTKIQTAGKQSNWAMFQVAYAIDDIQYGLPALTNNIVNLTTAFGGMIPNAAALTSTISAFAIAGTFAAVIYTNFDKILGWLDTTFTDTFKHKGPESVRTLTKELHEAEKVVDSLGAKAKLTRGEIHRFDEATAKVEKLTEKLKEQHKVEQDIENLRSQRSEGEKKSGQAVSDIFGKHGGAGTEQEIRDAVKAAGGTKADADKAISGAARGQETDIGFIAHVLKGRNDKLSEEFKGTTPKAIQAKEEAEAAADASGEDAEKSGKELAAARKRLRDRMNKVADEMAPGALGAFLKGEPGTREEIKAQAERMAGKPLSEGSVDLVQKRLDEKQRQAINDKMGKLGPRATEDDALAALRKEQSEREQKPLDAKDRKDEAEKKRQAAAKERRVREASKFVKGGTAKSLERAVNRNEDYGRIVDRLERELAAAQVDPMVASEVAERLVQDAIRKHNANQAGKNLGRGQAAADVGRAAGGRLPAIKGGAGIDAVPRAPIPAMAPPKIEIKAESKDDYGGEMFKPMARSLERIDRNTGKALEGIPAVLG